MNRTALSILVLVLLLIAPVVASAQSYTEPPPTGTFQMRAELQGTHPRLFFTADELPALRAAGQGPRKWFVDRAREAYAHYNGRAVEIDDGWKHYLFGFWGQFSMVVFSLVDEDTSFADTAIDWALYYARRDDWLEDDLVPMDITSGMALTYDVLYDQLTESERGELRAALYRSADFIYDEFFLGEYWTGDFQNNHMHNRVQGLALAALAIYGDDPAFDVQAHADLAFDAFGRMVEWLPEDGSCHEGPGYFDYGHHWVVRVSELMKHCTGVDQSAANPYFVRDHLFRIYTTAPGWQHTFGVGDGGGDGPSNATAWAPSIVAAQDGEARAILDELTQARPEGFYQHAAWGLLWYDETLSAADYHQLPLSRFWEDLEMFTVRSSWDDDATAFLFKCGPPGGHKMQQKRGSDWVNMAHDHPDQNHIMLFAHGTRLAEDDGYPREQKLTRSHNTIAIDGLGGPREEGGWYQPFDYALTATMDDKLLSGATAFATGNASALYEGASTALRHVFFLEGEYLIVLDDLVATDGLDHEFSWRLHNDGVWSQGDPGQFVVTEDDVGLDIQFVDAGSGLPVGSFLPAELTAPPCLSATVTAPSARFAAVLVPQQSGVPVLTSERLNAQGGMAVRVQHGSGVEDLVAVSNDDTLDFGAGSGRGRAAWLRVEGGAVARAMLVRGTELGFDGQPTLGAAAELNIVANWSGVAATVELEAPYKGTGRSTSVEVGHLSPDTPYTASWGGGMVSVQTNSDGVGSFEVDLANGPATVILEAGTPPADAPLPDTAAPDTALADTAGGDVSADSTATDGGTADPGTSDLAPDAPGAESEGGGEDGCGCTLRSKTPRVPWLWWTLPLALMLGRWRRLRVRP